LPKLKEFDYANGHIYIVKEDMDIYKLLAGKRFLYTVRDGA
jgi:hypothetical protein